MLVLVQAAKNEMLGYHAKYLAQTISAAAVSVISFAHFKPADTFVDLTWVAEMAKRYCKRQAARPRFRKCTGVELNTTLRLISQFRITTSLSYAQRRNACVLIKPGDMFQMYQVKEAEVVSGKAMESAEKRE
jgi:hypothetical protein